MTSRKSRRVVAGHTGTVDIGIIVAKPLSRKPSCSGVTRTARAMAITGSLGVARTVVGGELIGELHAESRVDLEQPAPSLASRTGPQYRRG